MRPLSFKRHRFPADVIRHAVWLYFPFSLRFRDVEELLARRGDRGQLRDDPVLDQRHLISRPTLRRSRAEAASAWAAAVA